MRTAALTALLTFSGCGFHVAANGTGSPGDAEGEAAPADTLPPDGPPADAFVPACMTDPSFTNGPDGHRYKLSPGGTYDSGTDACAATGAHLVAIDNVTENTFVKSFQSSESWIGFDDLTREGTFAWVTGNSSFTSWHGTEPNDSFGHEDCTYMRSDGDWNDTDCSDSRPAICECEVGYVAPPTPACRLANNAAGAVEHYGRRYIIHDTPLAWTAAEHDCALVGAYLFVPADDTENNAVDNDFPGDSWIGLSDAAAEGTWAWVDGAVTPYTKWNTGAGAPHANTPQRNCVIVNSSWTDVDCTTPERYACECDPQPP